MQLKKLKARTVATLCGLLLLGLAGSAQANIIFNPTSLDFGTTTVGSPVTRSFSAINISSEPIEFIHFTSVPSGYLITNHPIFPISPNYGSDTFTLRLTAASAGTFSGMLQLTFRGVNSGTYHFKQIWLSGTVNPACSSSPTASMTSPASGATVSPNAQGNVILQATASDSANGIARVEFYVDGNLVASDTSSPYAFAWPAKDGSHQVFAKAVNGCGNSTNSSSRSFTVNCGSSSVAFTAPVDGSTVSPNAQGNVILKATASHSTGIASVKFFVDGSLVATDVTSPYAYAWPATSGGHQAFVRVFSQCGGVATPSNRSNFTVP